MAVGHSYGIVSDRWWLDRWVDADQLPGHILIVILGAFLLMMSFQLFIKNRVIPRVE